MPPDWTPRNAARFPTVQVTKGPAKNNAGLTYYFNGRLLVEAIEEGLLGEEAARAWRTAPMGMTIQLFDINGIFRVLDRGSFDFEVIHILTVFERDGWRCHLCGGPIDSEVSHGPERWSLDHVVPIARGGGHTYDNVKASHWRCNHRKGTRSTLENRR